MFQVTNKKGEPAYKPILTMNIPKQLQLLHDIRDCEKKVIYFNIIVHIICPLICIPSPIYLVRFRRLYYALAHRIPMCFAQDNKLEFFEEYK
jgi:hypothetical protein